MTHAWLLSALAVTVLATSPLSAQDEEEEVGAIEGCVWRDLTLPVHGKANQQLSLRYQDCDGTNAAKVTYSLNDRDELIQTFAAGGQAHPVMHFWPLKGEKPSGLIPKVASPSLPEKEKGRCQLVLDFESRTYAFEPTAAYMEELLAVEEPFMSCGEFGTTNDAIQFFTTIENTLLIYLWLGQDTPLFDPESLKYVNTEKPGVLE